MEELTIADIIAMMEAGELSAKSLVAMYLENIEQIDRSGPALNSVMEINPEAIKIAEALDHERKRVGSRGPLHGVPIMIKGNIDTADRMTTTAGSLALEGHIAMQDSFVAQQLRHAGAIILGKTNLSEWANFRSEHSTSGWSSLGGQTKNPYALDRNPCGSSSGSGVAVAANLCAAAIGTETDGSIICPSHANGIVGVKPTVGLVGRSGIIPISHSQDTAGPMARTVSDAAILLGAITGVDPRDPITKDSQGKYYNDYTQFLVNEGLKGARIGAARNFLGFNPQVDKLFEVCLQLMKDQGAEIVDEANIETIEQFGDSEYEVLLYEFKAGLNAYLAEAGSKTGVKSLEDIIAFNEQHQDSVMPYFGQERMLKAQGKGPLIEDAYLTALKTSQKYARDEGIDSVIQKHSLDAIVAPTGGPAWLTDYINGDHYGGASSSPAAAAGYPNITVPAGNIYGLPIGISFFAGAYQEPTLIRLAYAFEQASQARRPPQFLPTVNLM